MEKKAYVVYGEFCERQSYLRGYIILMEALVE